MSQNQPVEKKIKFNVDLSALNKSIATYREIVNQVSDIKTNYKRINEVAIEYRRHVINTQSSMKKLTQETIKTADITEKLGEAVDIQSGSLKEVLQARSKLVPIERKSLTRASQQTDAYREMVTHNIDLYVEQLKTIKNVQHRLALTKSERMDQKKKLSELQEGYKKEKALRNKLLDRLEAQKLKAEEIKKQHDKIIEQAKYQEKIAQDYLKDFQEQYNLRKAMGKSEEEIKKLLEAQLNHIDKLGNKAQNLKTQADLYKQHMENVADRSERIKDRIDDTLKSQAKMTEQAEEYKSMIGATSEMISDQAFELKKARQELKTVLLIERELGVIRDSQVKDQKEITEKYKNTKKVIGGFKQAINLSIIKPWSIALSPLKAFHRESKKLSIFNYIENKKELRETMAMIDQLKAKRQQAVVKGDRKGVAEATRELEGQSKKAKELTTNLNKTKIAWASMAAGAVGALAWVTNATPQLGAQMSLLRHHFNMIGREIGKELVPAMKVVVGWMKSLSDWFKDQPKWVKQVIAVFLVIVGALVAIGGAIAFLTPIIAGLGTLWGSLATVGTFLSTTVFPAIAGALGAITLPVVAVVAAIAALIAIAVFLPQIFDKWNEAMNSSNKFVAFFAKLLGILFAPVMFLATLLRSIFTFFKTLIDLKKEGKSWGEAFGGAFKMAGEEFKKFGDFIGNAISLVLDPLKALIDWVKNTFNEVTWDNIWNVAATEEFTRFTEFIGEAVQWIVDFFNNLLDNVIEVVTNLTTKFMEGFSLLSEFITTWITDKLANFGMFGEVLTAIFTGFMSGIQAYVQLVMNTIKTIFKGVTDIISNIVKAFGSLLSGDFDGFLDHIKGAMEAFNDMVTGLWGNLKDFLFNIGNSIKDTLIGIFGGMFDKITEGFNGFGDSLKNIWNGLWETFSTSNISQSVVDFIMNTGLADKYNYFLEGLVDKATGITETEIGGFKPLSKFTDGIKKLLDWKIPTGSFATGLMEVPRDMTARIHQGEMIVPATFAESLRSMLGSGRMTSQMVPTINNNYMSFHIVVHEAKDAEDVARQVTDQVMEEINRQVNWQ